MRKPINPDKILKRSANKIEEVRTIRPSNREEISAIQEALAPTRRAYVKLCGRLAPTASLSESYSAQLAHIQKAFDQTWTQFYKDIVPPKLPALHAWKGGVSGLYTRRKRSASVIRRFDVEVKRKLETIVQRLQDKGQGPFWELSNQLPAVKAINRRVQNANAHCLNKRHAFFVNRPSLANATEAQKWCLVRLHQSWKQKGGIPSAPTTVPSGIGLRHTNDTSEAGGTIVEGILEDRPDQFITWLQGSGMKVWEAHWQHMTRREYGEWIAPIDFAASLYDTFPDVPEKVGFTRVGADGSPPITNHHWNFGSAASLRREAIRGENVFMGGEDGMVEL